MNKRKIKKYQNFRKNYEFEYKDIIEKDGNFYFNNELIEDQEKKYFSGETFINISYNSKEHLSRMLSNLYPMEFTFRGKKVKSIEGVLQGIKYKDKKIQNLVLKYSGIDAYHTRGANTLDVWTKTQRLYWQGKEMARESEEYQDFLDELYLSAIKNPLYLRALISTEDKYLLHHIGNTDIHQTVLTRFEYEQRLNSLRAYIKSNKK
ncbi:MAG: hypothetical protein IKC11_05070 [Clostridia bacterium]|nr:hypothetical protein [Clostridia bacterium]